MKQPSRRQFLTAAGAGTAVLIAGCSGDDDDGGNGNGNGNGNGGVPSEIDDYLGDANLYDGSAEDMTGEDSVTVEVGAGDNGFAFDPAAIRVDSGTTVTWEWTGEGGQHNVVDEDGGFESDLAEEEGHTFEQTFDESGNVRYYCNPHRTSGMKGGVIVE